MDRTIPKLPKSIKGNPNIDAIINKLPTHDNNRRKVDISANNLQALSSSINDRIKNNESIVELFPDVELSIQILTSSILAPNDMLSTNVTYKIDNIDMPNEVNNNILTAVKKYVDKNYKLEDKLMTILRESLFTKGTYIEAIIPENKINEVVNIDNKIDLTLESFTNPTVSKGSLGIFKTDNKVNKTLITLSIENLVTNDEPIDKLAITDFDTETFNKVVDISDDVSVLFAAENFLNIVERNIRSNVYNKEVDFDVSTEDRKLQKMFNKNTDKNYAVVNLANDNNTVAVGKPLIMKLTTESVIPVHVVNDPTRHLGYFILVDFNGTPITGDSLTNTRGNSGFNLEQVYAMDNKTSLINKAKTALVGITKKDPTLENLEELYTKIIEQAIQSKLKSSKYGELAEVANDTDLYRVMFSRALAEKQTRMIYVPKDMLMYYAFDYRENGTGRSYLEKVAMLFSIRSIILFSNIMGTLKNSVTTTEVSAVLDENDPDPEATMEKIIAETLKTRQTQLPIGVTNINDLVEWSQKVGFKYNFKHPSLPDMQINIADVNTNKIVPDDILDEKIQEFIIMSFGLTKELVRSGYDPEFATTVISKNILLAKRVIQLQDQFTVMLSNHIRKLIINDPNLQTIIRDIALANAASIKKMLRKDFGADVDTIPTLKSKAKLADYVVELYSRNIAIELPRPEMQETANMQESLNTFMSSLDLWLDNVLSSTALPQDFLGEMSSKMDTVKSVMKTILVKNWMTDNNFIPEMSDFLTLDNEGKPKFNILDEYNDYVESLSKVILPFVKKNKKFQEVNDERLSEGLGEEQPGAEETFDDDGTGGVEGDPIDDGLGGATGTPEGDLDGGGLGDDLGVTGEDPTGEVEETPTDNIGENENIDIPEGDDEVVTDIDEGGVEEPDVDLENTDGTNVDKDITTDVNEEDVEPTDELPEEEEEPVETFDDDLEDNEPIVSESDELEEDTVETFDDDLEDNVTVDVDVKDDEVPLTEEPEPTEEEPKEEQVNDEDLTPEELEAKKKKEEEENLTPEELAAKKKKEEEEKAKKENNDK